MSRFAVGNLYLLGSVTVVTISHVMIKGLIDALPEPLGVAQLRELLRPAFVFRGTVAALLLVAGFVLWLQCLVRLDLSYAYPIACSSVVLVTLFSVLVLGEPVTWKMWVGTILIVVGVVMLRPD